MASQSDYIQTNDATAFIDSNSMQFTGIEPTRAHDTDAGYDLASRIHAVIEPGQRRLIATGTSVAIPAGHFGSIRDRSSMAVKGIHVLGGVIDAGYRDEIKVILVNLSDTAYRIDAGDRVAQMIVQPCAHPPLVYVDHLPPADRGTDGFGSTGK